MNRLFLVFFLFWSGGAPKLFGENPPGDKPFLEIISIQVFYVDPWIDTGIKTTAESLVKWVKSDPKDTAFIELSGLNITKTVSSKLQKELAQTPTKKWIRDQLDARIVFRFFLSKEKFYQLTFQDYKTYEWNNISASELSTQQIDAIIDLLPKTLIKLHDSLLESNR